MGGAAGYAFPPMTAEEVRRTAIPGTVSLAIEIGRAVLAARAALANPVDAALSVAGGQRLFHGKIVDVERRLLGGFARGVLQLEGSGADAGRTLRIDFQNENLIARTDDGEILAVVPDLICLVDEDSAEPITTEIVRYGLRVVVLGIPAPEMLKTPEALRGHRSGGIWLRRRALRAVARALRCNALANLSEEFRHPVGPDRIRVASQQFAPDAVAELTVVVAAEIAGDRVPVEQLGVERSVVAAVERIGEHLLGAGVSRGRPSLRRACASPRASTSRKSAGGAALTLR